MKSDVMRIIEEFRKSGKITDRYDMKASDIMTIRECCHNDYELITQPFIYGFAQGYKTAMAEKKKK